MPLTHVDQLYVTASMTRPDVDIDGARLGQIHRAQGLSEIAVHYVILRNGTLYRGRSITKPGCFARKANMRSIQVCLIGGVSADLEPANNFTSLQIKALTRLAAEYDLPVVFDRYCPIKEIKQ